MTNIIVPLYNQGIFLKETILSCFSQYLYWGNKKTKYKPNITITVIDDCSTDNSYAIASKLQKDMIMEGRFFTLLKNKKNKGVNYTRNLGIKNTNGDYIICLDADDIIPNNYISACLAQIDRGYDIVYSDMQLFGEYSGIITFPPFSELQLRFKNILHSASFFKRKVWKKINGFDDKLKIYEDWDFWLRASKEKFKITKTTETGLLYRRHKNSVLINTDLKERAKHLNILRKKLGDYFKG